MLAAVKRLPLAPPRLQLTPDRIWADGYDAATLSVDGPDDTPPLVSLAGPSHSATIGEPERHAGRWEVQIRAGAMPGRAAIRVQFPGGPPATTALTVALSPLDSRQDGTPDFLRLDDPRDQRAFRRWFTFLAEAQYFQDPAARPPEINDCAALIRYAYREALHAHDNAWTSQAHLPLMPALPSPAKYEYPYTALGAALFRVEPGPFRETDLTTGAFTQFADVKSLWRFNTYPASRNLDRAQSGDLLFYRQDQDHGGPTFHSMIYLGQSQFRPDGARYVVYHTGPQVAAPGEIRRLTLDELRRFPEPEWRPDRENPRFIGVFRWNILKASEAQP
jgi:uncharacterized protein YfaT (DUF1175 family)